MSGTEKTNFTKETWERDKLNDDTSKSPSIDTVPQVELQIQSALPVPTENCRVGMYSSCMCLSFIKVKYNQITFLHFLSKLQQC